MAADDRTADYVIEHRHGSTRRVIAQSIRPLAPLAAHLEAQGAQGELVIVRKSSGDILVRWRLRSSADSPELPANQSP